MPNPLHSVKGFVEFEGRGADLTQIFVKLRGIKWFYTFDLENVKNVHFLENMFVNSPKNDFSSSLI